MSRAALDARRGARPPVDGSGRGSSELLVLLAVAAAVASFGLGAVVGHTGMLLGLGVAPLLALLVAPIIQGVARTAPFDIGRLLWAAFWLKMAAASMRWLSVYELYDGVGDAAEYHENGVILAESFRRLDFGVEVGQQIPGTGFLRYVTGVVYVFTGSNQFAAFLVFSTMAFLGLVFCYLGFRAAVPEANHRRYVLLLFFWPSILFWPSSIGKDAWMVLSIGLAAWGAGRLLGHRRGGIPLLLVGLLSTSMLRPHITLLVFVALVGAYVLRPGSRFSGAGPIVKAIGLVSLLFLGSFIASRTEEFFGIDDLSSSSVNEALDETQRRSSQGGSGFSPIRVENPANYPLAFVTVLLRPFPHEAHNAQSVMSALEGLLLCFLAVRYSGSILGVPRLVRRLPYLAFAGILVLLFVYAFASIGNFGILARQRSQILPFVFVFLSLPLARGAGPHRAAEVTEATAVEGAPPRWVRSER